MKFAACVALALVLFGGSHWNIDALAADDGAAVDRAQYANRPLHADFTAAPCAANPRGLEQIKGNLYRHTTGGGLAVHSGLVLVTSEGALVIDPAMTWRTGCVTRSSAGSTCVWLTSSTRTRTPITSAAPRSSRTIARSSWPTSARSSPSSAKSFPRFSQKCASIMTADLWKTVRPARGEHACSHSLELSQEVISGHTSLRALRPIRIPRCCRPTPSSPVYSMIRTSGVCIA